MKNLNYTLYLASNSNGRKKLLNKAKIKYKTISHSYDEIVEEYIEKDTLKNYVLYVSRKKLNYVNINQIEENDFLILVSDTMVFSNELNRIIGKPKDLKEAYLFIDSMCKQSSITGTAFHIGIFKNKKLIEIKEGYAEAEVFLKMDNNDINNYLNINKNIICNFASGLSIELVMQHVEKIYGSYTAIIGLPICEVLNEIKKIAKI